MSVFGRDLPSWLRQVRMSAHACRVCGAMVSLDLLEEHARWHADLGRDLN